MAADKMKDILKHFPDLEEGWKKMEEKLKAEPAEREMLSLRERQVFQMEMLKENLPEPEFTKAKRADSDLKVIKANEAPEKIYLKPLLTEDGGSIVRRCTLDRIMDSQVEYTRTDVFIDKAERYIRSVADGLGRDDDVEAFISDFRKYMEG